MKSIYKLICACFVLQILLVTHFSFGADVDKPTKASARKEFVSPNTEGLIGITENSPVDNPVDNIFHVTVNESLCGDEKVWLVYDLEGVADHTGVSRSINDQVAVGGYLVKMRRGWATQREQVSAAWLKEGDNVIRFTMPGQAQHSYRIRNLRFEVESSTENNSDIKIVFNQPSRHYFFDKAYVKGFVSGAGYQNVKVKIDGKEARMFNGEFESIIDFRGAERSCSAEVEVILADGSTTCDQVTFSEPQSVDFNYAIEQYTHRSEKFFDVTKGGILSLNGAVLTITESALNANTVLSITTLRSVDIPALDGGMVNVTKNNAGFRFLPHGTIFNKEVNVAIPFDIEKIPDGYTENDIRTYYFDEQNHHWVPLPTDTVLLEKGEIVSKTTHFTDLISGIIKVPESPETESYNSTSIKGIKAVTPAAGITLIEPPQASSSGGASLAYPITIPAGRGGMQPQLSVSYSSGGGNGWMGLGWDLSVPSISIDTRWGVPRYDLAKETETYSMNGEQLSPVAHRDVALKAREDEKRFYPRIEGAFHKIIRHGNSPANYWWEVTDKAGTRYSYGGSNGAFDERAVLRTKEESETSDKGYVAQWCLRETRDLNGNTVRYHYAKIPHPGVTGGSMGYQIYVNKITYTGFRGEEGPYAVDFIREQVRPDKIVNGTLGFKQVTADRLKEIIVWFKNEKVRSYTFKYVTGAFSKMLLESVNELDSKGNPFNSHKFDYYNEVGKDASFKPLGEREEWNPQSDGVKGKFLVTEREFTDKASALSGSKGKDKGLGMTVTAGIADGNMTAKSLTVGGSFGYSVSESEGLLTLIDIDGDGLSDKVYMKGGKLFYRPNPSGVTTNTSFGKDEEITLIGTDNFQKEKSKTTNVGLEANAGYGSASAFVGWGKSKTTSVTSVYFAEVNGDQLIDLVVKGKVYFNHIDPATGRPVFTASSSDTPSPILGTGSINGGIITVDNAEKEIAITENPLHDVVRMWRAPYNGSVKITGPARLLQSGDPERQNSPADGVRVNIQHNENPLLWSSRINANDYGEHKPALNSVAVRKGDKIFFRVQSVDNGSYDSVQWSPVIEYVSSGSSKPDTLAMKDANRKQLYRFSAADDYVHTAQQTITPPFKGTVRIEGDFFKPVTSDSLSAEILQINANQDTTIVWDYNGAWNDSGLQPLNKEIAIDTTEYLVFRVSASTNINWSAVKWQPHMYYIASGDARYAIGRDADGNPDPMIEFYPIPEYTLFADMRKISKPWIVGSDIAEVSITPELEFANSILFPPLNGTVIFSVKKPNELLHKDTLEIIDGVMTEVDAISLSVEEDDSLYIEYHFPNHRMANRAITTTANLEAGSSTETVEAGVYTVFWKENEQDVIYGPLYRQWGQFVYNGNRTRADELIHLADLKLDGKLKDAPRSENVKNSNDLDQGAYNPSADKFIVMTPRGKEQTWGGYDAYTFLSASVMSSSRMGEKDLSGADALSGGGARAVNKISKSESKSYSAGAGVGVVGGSYNNTYDAFNHLLVDYMDMNGDRYPDIVTDQKIQYTTANGGLETEPREHTLGINHKTLSSSDGFSVSGSFVTPKTEGSVGGDAKDTRTSVGNAKVSGGISGNFGKGDDNAQFTWMDINGDGLPDKVHKGGMVALNLGYRFTEPENWGFGDIQKGHSESKGAGLSINIGTGSQSASFAAGVGLALSENYVLSMLQDMNGDGLADQVYKGDGIKVILNNGAGFSPDLLTWNHVQEVTKSSTASQSANVSFTGCFPIWLIKICINPSVTAGNSVSRDLYRLSDMDGDGYPDYTTSSDDDGDLDVYRSRIGRTNMLKGVTRPLGATFKLSYARVGNTYEMPNAMWVMDSLKLFDGFAGDGVDNMLTTFKYEGGLYDRYEREFYGFKKVITNAHDTDPQKSNKPVYTAVTRTFKNNNYYEKGLMLTEVMTDGEGKKFTEKENRYELKDVISGATLTGVSMNNDPGKAFPALVETFEKYYEGEQEAGKSTRMTYTYNKTGDIATYTDFADEGAEDDLSATITYHDLQNIYVIGTPEKITVTGSGKTYRKRESVIDPATGDIKKIRQFLSDAEYSEHDMEYDEYGNINKIIRPKNAKGQRLSYTYEYDNSVHNFITKVTSSYGYSSESVYDFRFGQLLLSKDVNGNEIKYELDDKGRIANITGPYEKGGANKTIEFEYDLVNTVPVAITKHFDYSDPKNKLQTAIFVDGLGRVLQTKKDVALFAGDGKPDTEMMSVSGRVFFDAFGRTVKVHYPVVASASTPKEFVRDPDTSTKPTLTTYDVLNRTLSTILPDLAKTTTAYGFDTDREGKKQFITKTIDANGKQAEQFTDVKGRATAVRNYLDGKAVWTSFKFNALNEQTEATDDLGHTIFASYDNLGRRVSRKHPDAGTTTYAFDLAGNLIEVVTANLAKKAQAITYTYDFERLTDITYPENLENNVKYTYGAPGATDNRVGRIVLQEDATGAQESFYGPLGEVVKSVRTIVIPQHSEQTYTTEWQYDTWNRLTSMTYPDGEKVTYTYNAGGLLRSMEGKKKNATYAYVTQLGYDKFEQRVFLAYGNGTKTTYSYEADRKRLQNMTARTAAKRLFIDNTYTYDKVNNILSMENNAPVPASNLMGGASEYTYEYDDLYRLTSASGSYKGSNDNHTYALAMDYNSVGGITKKTQVHKRKEQEQKKTTYNLNYTYSSEQPHAPVHIGDQTYKYDANGNQMGWTSDISGQRRNIMWDEENRMRAVYDNGALYHYVYDASGDRVLKGQSTGQRIFVNGEWKAGSGQMGNYTVYVNQYLVLKSGGYTKHYYIEDQRIVSKLGGGWDNNGKGPLKAGDGKVDYAGKTQKVFEGIVKNLKFLGADGQVLTAGKSGKVPPGQLNGMGGNVTEAFRYFYHPDHLGSTSFITDAAGEVYQHLEYFAFGETFIEEHSNTDRTPYLFSGKELDEETGLYYFGARYYDPRISIWQSVDPMADKYPAWSPYNYTLNNPIILSDPDGNSPISVLAKMLLKQGLKAGIKKFAKEQIEARLKQYMSKNLLKQFAKDLDGIMETLDNAWWETAIELVPVAGDIYGGTRFGMKIAKVYQKLQDLENKYVEKVYDALPEKAKKEFKDAMRSKGVKDARKDQKAGVEEIKGETYVPTKKGDPIENQIEGHHKERVTDDPSQMTDPRNIEFLKYKDHKKVHAGDSKKKKN